MRVAPRIAVLASALVTVNVLLAVPAAPERGPAPPNIVFILTDDQRRDSMWALPTVESEIGAKGLTFEQGIVVNPLCCPSRASLLTGQHSHTTGVYRNNPPDGGWSTFRPLESSTVATWLDGAGYRTALFGKYMNGYVSGAASYVPPGWDRWLAFVSSNGNGGYYDYSVSDDGQLVSYGSAPSDYSTDVLAAEAEAFVRETPTGEPLFLFFSPKAPHEEPIPAPRHQDAFAGRPPTRTPSYNEADMFDKPAYLQQQRTKGRSVDSFALNQARTLLAVDEAVGRLVGALEDTGRMSNTLIVFMSDNGYLWGEHRWSYKTVPHEDSIRTPILMRYDPLIPPGRVDGHLVANIDIAPTFAELAGVPPPGAEGMSLVPLFAGPPPAWRSVLPIEHLQSGDGVPSYCGLRTERYAYFAYASGEEELYDLDVDPYQMQNSVGDPAYGSQLANLRSGTERLCPRPPRYVYPWEEPKAAVTSGPPEATSSDQATFTFSAPGSGLTYRCSLDGASPEPCASPKTYTGLPYGPHSFTVRAAQGNARGGATTSTWSVLPSVTVQAGTQEFVPAAPDINQGQMVLWEFTGSTSHTVTDDSGLGLFDSGPLAGGASFRFPFTGAGTYPYRCTIHGSTGTLRSSLAAKPTQGTVTTSFEVTWATAPAPEGYAYEVSIRRPGGSWEPWVTTQPQTAAPFVPDAGAGTYQFRGRLAQAGGGGASGWSPTLSLEVSG